MMKGRCAHVDVTSNVSCLSFAVCGVLLHAGLATIHRCARVDLCWSTKMHCLCGWML